MVQQSKLLTAVQYSDMSIVVCQTIQRVVQYDLEFHQHHCENLKFCTTYTLLILKNKIL